MRLRSTSSDARKPPLASEPAIETLRIKGARATSVRTNREVI
jgi:hypothetical protein